MKKIISTVLLFSMAAAFTFAASKKNNSTGIQLDPKTKFAIEGVELGTIDWYQATVTNKGEIIWSQTHEGDYSESGWDARGVDLSAYGAIHIELAPKQNQRVELKLKNPSSNGEWCYNFSADGSVYAFFNGVGKAWGEMKNPDLEEGFLIVIATPEKCAKTVIKSVELIKKEDIPDVSHLEIMGVSFGSIFQNNMRIWGNEVTWFPGYKDEQVGWDLGGIDISEYDRVRVEVENNTATNLGLRLTDKDWKNWHGFDNQIEPNVYEADLTGESASWKGDDAVSFDKTQGLKIVFQNWHEKPITKEEKTVIKSVQLLKDKKIVNEHLALNGAKFGTNSYHCHIYDGGVIEWDGKQDGHCAGWDVKDIDFSEWKKVRIEFEASGYPVDNVMLEQDGCNIGYHSVSPNVFEVNLDGSGNSWTYPEKSKWDSGKGIRQILISPKGPVKGNPRTIVKSVTLLKDGENEIQQPENLMLNGAKLGSRRDNAWLDDDFAINWEKGKYVNCGWKVEKLEGDILEIKVTSTDVPLRLRIREFGNKNEASWQDDGSHVFRINLKNRKQIKGKTEKDPEWVKMTYSPDYSQGCEIVLEASNGVYKEGKKTVVEYIKVE